MSHKKKIKAPDDVFELAGGVSTRPYEESTKRDLDISIMLKALIVVFMTIGSIGSYLSAVDITYSRPLFILAVIIQAVIFSLFYRSSRLENTGALLFFLVFVVAAVLLHVIINSGFYAVVNQTIERVSFYFNTSGMRSYTERIENRYLTVTVFAITIGVVLEFFLFSNVLRRAAYIWCIILTVTLNLVMIYVQRSPAYIYTLMLVTGLALTIVIRSGGHYRLFWGKNGYARTRHGITYTADAKMLTQIMAVTAVVVAVIVAGTGAVAGQGTFDENQAKSAMKADNEDMVKNAFMLGFDGLFNRYPTKGGLNSGKLGGVSSVTQDYQPDLQLTYVPYSQDTVYIRSFIGEKYNPVQNFWTAIKKEQTAGTDREAASLKDSFEKNKKGGRGVMTIENVGGDIRPYQPYYSLDGNEDLGLNSSQNVTYYPLLNEKDIKVSQKADDESLNVPQSDTAAIEEFCKEAGLKKGMDPQKAVDILKAYFQRNYPYTLRPGATPRNRDFVEYFLTTNKKGYCAHFASSAVLILRYLGIPARYCEGYAVSVDTLINNAETQDDLSVSDYYSGENEFGSRAAVIKVAATDANAHAWVEVLTNGHGWQVEEFTPPSTEDNGAGGGILSNLMNIFTGGGNSDDTTQQNTASNGARGLESLSLGGLRVFFVIIIIILAVPAAWFGLRRLSDYLRYRNAYSHAGTSDRLILRWQRRTDRLRRHSSEFRRCVNYEQQVAYMYPEISRKDAELVVDILTRAGYSGRDITEDEFNTMTDMMK